MGASVIFMHHNLDKASIKRAITLNKEQTKIEFYQEFEHRVFLYVPV